MTPEPDDSERLPDGHVVYEQPLVAPQLGQA